MYAVTTSHTCMLLYSLVGAKSFSPLLDGAHVWVSELTPLSLLWLIIMALVALVTLARLLLHGHKLKSDASADAEFLEGYSASEQPLEIYLMHRIYQRSMCHAAYQKTVKELCHHLVGAHTVNSELINRLRASGKISPTQMDAIRHELNASVNISRQMIKKRASDGGLISLLALGLAGASILAMEQSMFDQAVWRAFPTLLPVTAAILVALCIKLWQKSHAHRAFEAGVRLQRFAATLASALDRHFIDHRRPLDSLPSLAGMSFSEGPTFSQSPAENPPSRATH